MQYAGGKLVLLLLWKTEAMRSSETPVDFYGLHGITSQKAALFIVTAEITANPM